MHRLFVGSELSESTLLLLLYWHVTCFRYNAHILCGVYKNLAHVRSAALQKTINGSAGEKEPGNHQILKNFPRRIFLIF